MLPWNDWLQNGFSVSRETYTNLAFSAVIIASLWLLRRWIFRVGLKKTDLRTRYQWQKTSSYVFYLLAALLLGPLWLGHLQNLATYLGLLTAGLAIALKDPIANIFGWLFILWRRPFEVGDRIELGPHAGDVVDLRLFQFTLMEIGNWVDADQSTGRLIHIPNGRVFTDPLANYNKAFTYIWNEIPVPITFESNWSKAKALLTRIASKHGADVRQDAEEQIKKAAGRFMIHYAHLTPIVYTGVQNNGVLLTIRYLCKPHARRQSEQVIWEEILEAFRGDGEIEFAYPTQRFYDATLESRLARDRAGEPMKPGRSKIEAAPLD